MSIYDYGYGVDMSRAKFCNNAAQYVMANLASESLKTDLLEFMTDNPELDAEEAVVEFVDSYEDDIHCNTGLEAIIVRCINDNECNGRDEFLYEDHCIYVGARIPRNDADRSAMKTMEEIQSTLAKYLCPNVIETPISIESLEIHE